jgi:cell division protein FtsB
MKNPKNKEECLQMTIDSFEQVLARKDKFIRTLLESIENLNEQAEQMAAGYLALEKENQVLNALVVRLKEQKDFNDLIQELEGL